MASYSISHPDTTATQNPQPSVTTTNPQQSEMYITPQRTTLIPADSFEVVYEMLIDLENLRHNGFNLFPAVEFQG